MNDALVKKMGYFILGSYAVFNVFSLFIVDRFPIGYAEAGPYSIYSSKGFFIAYHLWGILLAVVTMYSMWKEIRMLFMTSLLLMMIVMFYPYFTAGPMDSQVSQKEQVDPLQNPEPDSTSDLLDQ
ncbi:MAG TPA: hypothetical protein ENJ82_09695 [Bacteroidetes bacterium]|nr:hypothetical protein [Bacteroidota bacterium]